MNRVTKYLTVTVAAALLTLAAGCGAEEPPASVGPTDVPQPAVAETAQPPTATQPAAAQQATSAPAAATATSAPAATSGSTAATDVPTVTATAAVTQPPPADPPAATSPPASATETPTAVAAPTDTPAPAAPPAPPPIEAPAADVGNEVGETPPAFSMDLSDGSRIESADIVGSGRPVFMHYFATW